MTEPTIAEWKHISEPHLNNGQPTKEWFALYFKTFGQRMTDRMREDGTNIPPAWLEMDVEQ